MKHTELYNKYDELQKLEYRELAAAIKAHGGEYVFIHLDNNSEVADMSEIDEAPMILGLLKYASWYENIYVSRVAIEDVGNAEQVCVYGWPVDPGWSDEQQVREFAYGHIDFITNLIPETPEISDVTEPVDNVPVLFLSRQDVKDAGCDASLDNETMEELASSLRKHLDADDFQLSLSYAIDEIIN